MEAKNEGGAPQGALIEGRDALLAALNGRAADDLGATPPGTGAPGVSASDSGAAGKSGEGASGEGAAGAGEGKGGEAAGKGGKPDTGADEIKAERLRLEQERAAFLAEKAKFESEAASVRSAAEKAAGTAEDYERWANDWEKEGRTDLANSARLRARELRQEAESAKRRAQQAEISVKRDAVLRELVQQNPELRDPSSALFKSVDALLKERPILTTYPDGIRDAVEFVQARSSAGRVKSLEAEVAKLKDDLAAKEKLLQPSRGGSTAPPATEEIETLPADERRKRLLSALQKAESEGNSPFQ